uniref:AcidPPc domain-containing protein n=1 Tax=Onchocerca volvulus TaxID=6282 RepID=A0A2K6VDL9_ONCVO
MSLRRVTFSGRFAQYESKADESITTIVIKGLFAVAIDVGIALAVAVFALNLLIGKLVAPFERGFYCYQVPYINKPFSPNTISTKHLLAVSLGSPFFVIGLVEAVVFMISEGRNKLRKYFQFTTSIYLIYIGAFVLATFLMEVLKCTFARLRPHFLSVCQPNWNDINCNNPNTYIENINCMGTDMHRIRVGRQSFPSGHSSTAVLLFIFFYSYLKGIVDATGNKSLRIIRFIILLTCGIWGIVVMVTRMTDNWHYPTDVLGGIILGILCSCVFIRKTRSSLVYQDRSLERMHNT